MKIPKLEPQQKWGCSQCGGDPVIVKVINYEYSRTEDHCGNLLESLTEPRLVTGCCDAEPLLWDEEIQDCIVIPKE